MHCIQLFLLVFARMVFSHPSWRYNNQPTAFESRGNMWPPPPQIFSGGQSRRSSVQKSRTLQPNKQERRPVVEDSSEWPLEPPMGGRGRYPYGRGYGRNIDEPPDSFTIDTSCNSSELREIIAQGIVNTPSESKQRIAAMLRRNMDGTFAIICSDCSFTFLTHTIQYCHHTLKNITCFVYREGASPNCP